MSGAQRQTRRAWLVGLALVSGLLVLAGSVLAQGLRPNEREARPRVNVQDKDDIHKPDSKIWAMELTFYDPRLITVDTPGRAPNLCWYMKHPRTNNTP